MIRKKILMIGPYPPPEGGWSTAIREEREVLESKAVDVIVLNIGPNRKLNSEKYIRVFGGLDLLSKMFRFSLQGYIYRLHMNGDSPKGILIVLLAEFIQLLCLRRPCLSFHAGVKQRYFPHRGNVALKLMWLIVLSLPKVIFCDCNEVRELILAYRIGKEGVHAVSPFSSRRVSFVAKPLDEKTEGFLKKHSPVLFSYFAYRPEYTVDLIFKAFRRFKAEFPKAGFIAFDDRTHPTREIMAQFSSYKADIRDIMLLGSAGRDLFLTVLSRVDVYLRTPVTDGVCSSVLEALYLGVPVVAADNGFRPEKVITFAGGSENDLFSKLKYTVTHLEEIKEHVRGMRIEVGDSVKELVSILEAYYWK